MENYLKESGLCIMAIPQPKPKVTKTPKLAKTKAGTRELKNLSSSINYEKQKLLKGGPTNVK